ncbi:MAG: phospho-sugar mutase [Bacteroidales bacterium]|nr:phospho-sugar mutase [Bacteroidales bacterium]
MDKRVLAAAELWLGKEFDEQTRAQVQKLIDTNPKELEDAFYRALEFGTGGLRGIMGVGTNRMNIYTVGMATQGFANYLKMSFSGLEQIKVAVTFDCRNNSREFARSVAEIFEANGFVVYLTKELRPTPELSYAVRHYGCQGGVMLTASHNPPEYNGYKAYWSDGAQVIAPHDANIIKEVAKITSPAMVKFRKDADCKGRIELVGDELDELYLKDLETLHLSPESVARHSDIPIVYTPLHGCGAKIVPMALRRMGFKNINLVEEQCINDGNFPTVESPNPENPSAMKMALELAEKVKAEVIIASDPDADRCGMGVRNREGEMVLLNGNQMNSILTYYMLTRWKEKGLLEQYNKQGRFPYIIKTIVTTDLMRNIAEYFGVKWYNVLTGFKNIAEVIHYNEGKGIFVCGGEESFGFAVGEYVRDKDSPITCSMICECAAWCADRGTTIWGLLEEIYAKFGEYKNWLRQYTFPGIEGKKKIDSIVENFRNNPPKSLAGSPVVSVKDYYNEEFFAPEIKLAKSNVLQYCSEDGTTVSLRPSGTEPKIKFYFEIKCTAGEDVERKAALLDKEFEIK